MEIQVLNKTGKETGRTVDLNDQIYGIEPNDNAIFMDVKQFMANNRQGTSKSKERNEISGSTRKIKKQKGTGGARAGSIKSPLFRGGGRIFGPRPRSYSFKLNKKVKILARKSALSYKIKTSDILVVEDFVLDAPKTKEMVTLGNNLKVTDKKCLFILKGENNYISLSSRNLKGMSVVLPSELSTYQIMNANKIILFESSVGEIEKQFKI